MNRPRLAVALTAGIASFVASLLTAPESAANSTAVSKNNPADTPADIAAAKVTEQIATDQIVSEQANQANKDLAKKAQKSAQRMKPGNIEVHVHVPAAVKKGNEKVPLFVVLHGGLTNWLIVKLDSQICKRADKDGFIVAFPQGTFLTWNAGQCCGPAKWRRSDDVASVNVLIDELKDKYKVDPSRVYVVGSSNGAMLAQKLAMESPEKIAAFASVSGCLYQSKKESTVPISAFLMNGENDKVVRFQGGRGGLPIYRFDSTPAEMALQYWIERNQCQVKVQEDRSEYLMKDYCGEADTEVLYYQVKKGRHTWPGGLHAKIAGSKGDRLLNATDLICDFCLRHRRKQSP